MIYPISQMIEELMASAVDEDTGEILIPDEELQQKLEELQMSFDDKIVELRNDVINKTAEAEALKREKQKLAERQKFAENRAERAKRFLAWLLKGESFQKDTVKISYRKSEEVIVDDSFVEWAAVNAPGLLKIEPEPRKADIKKAIKNGTCFEHAHLEEKRNIQVK